MDSFPQWATLVSGLAGGALAAKLVDKFLVSPIESKDATIRERIAELSHIENLQKEVTMLWQRLSEMSADHAACQDQLTELKIRSGKQDVEIEVMKRAVANGSSAGDEYSLLRMSNVDLRRENEELKRAKKEKLA